MGIREGIGPKLRKRILERDGNRCQTCHATDNLEIDHCLPVCLGGNNNPLNLRVLCRECNIKRNLDIKRYRTKRVKEHVKKMELNKNKLLNEKELDIKRLQSDIRLKDMQLGWLENSEARAKGHAEWLEKRLSDVYGSDGIIHILHDTISVLQTGRGL